MFPYQKENVANSNLTMKNVSTWSQSEWKFFLGFFSASGWLYFFFSVAATAPTIFNIAPNLILPVYFTIFQTNLVTIFNLINQLNPHILIPTAIFSAKMMTQAPLLISYFNLVVAVSQLESSCGLSYILATTFGTCYQIDNMVAVTI